jgi:hypothetical protein
MSYRNLHNELLRRMLIVKASLDNKLYDCADETDLWIIPSHTFYHETTCRNETCRIPHNNRFFIGRGDRNHYHWEIIPKALKLQSGGKRLGTFWGRSPHTASLIFNRRRYGHLMDF